MPLHTLQQSLDRRCSRRQKRLIGLAIISHLSFIDDQAISIGINALFHAADNNLYFSRGDPCVIMLYDADREYAEHYRAVLNDIAAYDSWAPDPFSNIRAIRYVIHFISHILMEPYLGYNVLTYLARHITDTHINGITELHDAERLIRDTIADFLPPMRAYKFPKKDKLQEAKKVARVLYDNQQLTDLPILADALEEAGCTDLRILNHLKDQDQKHYRGCWVLDNILGSK